MSRETAPKACARPGCRFPAFASLTDEYGFESDPFCSAACRYWSEEALRVVHLPWSPAVEAESKLLVEAGEKLNRRDADRVAKGVI